MTATNWISVEERLPEQGKWWNRLYKGQYNVTHWMPLPAPPEVEK